MGKRFEKHLAIGEAYQNRAGEIVEISLAQPSALAAYSERRGETNP
jgi:hypothetical protein